MDNQSSQDDLFDSVSRLQNIVSRVQNTANSGVGQTMPANTRSGITIPPVSRLSATASVGLLGQTMVTLTWISPEVTSSSVSGYNIYTIGAFSKQANQPVLTARCSDSPTMFQISTDGSHPVRVLVQTVLSNGQVMDISNCPYASVTSIAIPIYANNTAAITGGLSKGSFYRSGADPDPVYVVH